MTFNEFAEQFSKEYPDGIWVHFNDDNPDTSRLDSERYHDEYYLLDFSHVLDREDKDYYLDECDYEILEVLLKWI